MKFTRTTRACLRLPGTQHQFPVFHRWSPVGPIDCRDRAPDLFRSGGLAAYEPTGDVFRVVVRHDDDTEYTALGTLMEGLERTPLTQAYNLVIALVDDHRQPRCILFLPDAPSLTEFLEAVNARLVPQGAVA